MAWKIRLQKQHCLNLALVLGITKRESMKRFLMGKLQREVDKLFKMEKTAALS